MSDSKKTILIVEDEEMLRGLICELLETKGYRVLAASNGEEAMQRISSDGESIALLLTDVMMPNMSGSELMEKARVKRPDLRILFMSGYTGNSGPGVNKSLEEPGVSFLQKPFRLNALLQKVESLITG